jgi:hypothetical protein
VERASYTPTLPGFGSMASKRQRNPMGRSTRTGAAESELSKQG